METTKLLELIPPEFQERLIQEVKELLDKRKEEKEKLTDKDIYNWANKKSNNNK